MINEVLSSGDQLWTDEGARAELRAGSASIHVAPHTDFSFLTLDDQTLQVRVTHGTIDLNLRESDGAELTEVDTPNAAVTLHQPGRYRIDVGSAGEGTHVTVREGEAEVVAGGSEVPVRASETGDFDGEDPVEYDLESAVPADDWESWADERDRGEDRAASLNYVSRQMTGYEDLDDNGTWRVEADYGPVWVPRTVAVGWAPYRFGRWVWRGPWGWTWIDDAPWGFAPFHYGRWAYVGAAWAWVPGTLVARPIYAPALVGFVGGGSWSVSASFGVGGGVAWFPLGPREVFVPPYAVSPFYARQVNVTSVNVANVNVTNVNVSNVTYVNRSVPGAVTAVSASTFRSAQPVGAATVSVPARSFAAASASTHAAIVPGAASLIASRPGSASVARPPAAYASRPVVARIAPAPAPVPFSQKQAALASSGGRPLDAATVAGLRSSSPGAAPAVKPVAPASASVAGLKPRREGLTAAEPVTEKGFVPRSRAVQPAVKRTSAPLPPARSAEPARPAVPKAATTAAPSTPASPVSNAAPTRAEKPAARGPAGSAAPAKAAARRNADRPRPAGKQAPKKAPPIKKSAPPAKAAPKPQQKEPRGRP